MPIWQGAFSSASSCMDRSWRGHQLKHRSSAGEEQLGGWMGSNSILQESGF